MRQMNFFLSILFILMAILLSGCSPRSWYVNDASVKEDRFTKAIGDKEKGDGSIDRPFLTINKAIQKASPGDTIFIDTGVYSVPQERKSGLVFVTLNKPKLNVEGAGAQKTILQLSTDSEEFQCGIRIAAEKIKLQNLGIKGGTIGIFLDQTDHVIIEHVSTEGQTANGFLLESSQNSEVSHCQAQKGGFRGFQIINSTLNKIHNNTSQDNENAGFCLIRSTNNYLQQNVARNNGMSGFFINGWNQSNRLENNQSISNTLGGFYLFEESEKNQLRSNFSQGNGVGISINNSHANVIISNRVISSIGNGIVLKSGSHSNQVLNNRLKNNQEPQIRVDKDKVSNQVEGNITKK